MAKSRILIADDAELNREMLTLMLGDRYEFLYATDGVEAVDILSSGESIDLVLLDVNMPNMDGFGVLRIMNERDWIHTIPVIIISAEDNSDFITKAYHLGVTDYISRPFHSVVVERRVENTLLMYAKQKRLVHLVERQVLEREKVNNTMISIFSDIIELRNHESGSHTLNVQTITHLLLTALIRRTDRYSLSKSDISLISTLAALHDIGKIKVPESILNKPGKLDPDEWVIMKSHTTWGDEILSSDQLDQSSRFVRIARSICRWHHEKYDGRGYPDGLAGDDIPIAAQVVSMADVYDALTSERCYKKAFTHERALEMILGGECGAFNPLLLESLKDVAHSLLDYSAQGRHYDFASESVSVADEILSTEELPQDNYVRRMLKNERQKKEFFMSRSDGILFEYDKLLGRITYVHLDGDSSGSMTVFTSRDHPDNILPVEYWDEFRKKLLCTTRENPYVLGMAELLIRGERKRFHANLMAIWPEFGTEYISVVGQFLPA